MTIPRRHVEVMMNLFILLLAQAVLGVWMMTILVVRHLLLLVPAIVLQAGVLHHRTLVHLLIGKNMTQQTVQQISSPADRKKIKDALHEISGSMTRIEAERDYIKEAIKELADEFKLSKRTLNKMARVYHKQNYSQEVANHEEFEGLYETIVELKNA